MQLLIVNENPEKMLGLMIRQWEDKLEALDLLGVELKFELVYSYHAFFAATA